MTNDHGYKKSVRAYAADRGLPYMQAKREFDQGLANVVDHIVHELPHELLVVTIQQEPGENHKTPFPFPIEETGIVAPQGMWDGDPCALVGFAADPDSMRIDLHREAFFDDPDAAVGMHPVMADEDGRFVTFRGAVVSARPRITSITPVRAVRADFAVTTPDGTLALSVPFGHILDHLTTTQIQDLRAAGWTGHPLIWRMLKWAARSGDQRALDLEEHAATWEADEVHVEAVIDSARAEEWLQHETAGLTLAAERAEA